MSSICESEELPPLDDGREHDVSITYDVRSPDTNNLRFANNGDIPVQSRLAQWISQNGGILKVAVDGEQILTCMIDIAFSVAADSVDTYKDINDYSQHEQTDLEYPGAAWVGFLASTSLDLAGSVDILRWHFHEFKPCTDAEAVCNKQGASAFEPCGKNGEEFCRISIKNIGSQPVSLVAQFEGSRQDEPTPCADSQIQYDTIHPYFLGCSQIINFIKETNELWVFSQDGQRRRVINDPYVLDKGHMPFKKQTLQEFCLKEHPSDPFMFHLANCNCEFCDRVHEIQRYYQLYHQEKCTARYGTLCDCFEVSTMQWNDNRADDRYPPGKFLSTHICRGCVYDSQCNIMLKAARCSTAIRDQIVGNPLEPTVLNNIGIGSGAPSHTLMRDRGRVFNGILRGDACDCDPGYRGIGYGLCGTEPILVQEDVVLLDDCWTFCQQVVECQKFGHNPTKRTCTIFSTCSAVSCNHRTFDFFCEDEREITYEKVSLSIYNDIRYREQLFNVFRRATLQTSYAECFDCLRQFDQEDCYFHCGQAFPKPLLHWPGGQSCASCMFASNVLLELNSDQKNTLRACATEAMSSGASPWVHCKALSNSRLGHDTHQLFNGVATHFLTECPSRPFDIIGAVCAPNIWSKDYFPSQILDKMSAVKNQVWDGSLECVNAYCRLSAKANCYRKLVRWDFTTNSSKDTIYGLELHMYNNSNISEGALNLEADYQSYALSDPLPESVGDKSLEIWAEIAEKDRITNLARQATVIADSFWHEDYMPYFIYDDDLETFEQNRL